jgi:6-pyruvoyltetrahydropterin/6-carboxytetrahydropterin synthase
LEEIMQQRGEFRVLVTKDYLVFASAHFITFAGHRCEGLHGHNYRVGVTIEGRLNEESWFVFDFVELKRIMRGLCDAIDHLVLLPQKSTRVQVVEEGEVVKVAVDGKPRYVFPRRDCALLPIPNTTVEMLAEMLTDRLRGELETAGAKGVTAIEMEVEENFGQSAVYRIALG